MALCLVLVPMAQAKDGKWLKMFNGKDLKGWKATEKPENWKVENGTMHPLTRQVQMTCDNAKFTMARLGGVDAPAHPDTETSVAELKERIAKTIAFVESVPAAKVDASVDREIVFKAGPMELKFSGADYLGTWGFPNFYFHLTTAYAILRHNGVVLGKRDFLMGGA